MMPYVREEGAGKAQVTGVQMEDAMISRDTLIREARARGGNLPTLLFVYLVLVATMAGSALAIV